MAVSAMHLHLRQANSDLGGRALFRLLGVCMFLCLHVLDAATNPKLQLHHTRIRTPHHPDFHQSKDVLASQNQLRLRGGQIVNQIPPPVHPPQGFESVFESPLGEAALQSAEEALAAGEFKEARNLRQKAILHFVEDLCVSKWQDVLAELEERIESSEAMVKAAVEEKPQEPPHWSVSPHLNLTKAQLDALEGWIGRPVQADRVLYLSSKHGFESRRFHKLCDNKVVAHPSTHHQRPARGPTVTIVRTDTGHIFGGYTSQPWSKGTLATKPPRWQVKFVEDTEAFVFRLTAPAAWKAKSYDELFGVSYDDKVIGPFFWNKTGDFNVSYRDARAGGDAAEEVMGEAKRIEGEGSKRWGLDVQVPGIANQTDITMADVSSGREEEPGRASMSDGDENTGQQAGAEPTWLPPAVCRASFKEPSLPQLRHVSCLGPCFTHALELDLDNPGRSFSDLLSGAIYAMPDDVPDADERVFLAGKIGGRSFEEKSHTEARWWMKEVAVIAV